MVTSTSNCLRKFDDKAIGLVTKRTGPARASPCASCDRAALMFVTFPELRKKYKKTGRAICAQSTGMSPRQHSPVVAELVETAHSPFSSPYCSPGASRGRIPSDPIVCPKGNSSPKPERRPGGLTDCPEIR